MQGEDDEVKMMSLENHICNSFLNIRPERSPFSNKMGSNWNLHKRVLFASQMLSIKNIKGSF